MQGSQVAQKGPKMIPVEMALFLGDIPLVFMAGTAYPALKKKMGVCKSGWNLHPNSSK